MFRLRKYRLLIHLLFWLCLVLAMKVIFQITIVRDIEVNGKTEPLVFEIRILRPLMIGLLFKMGFFYTNSFFLVKRALKRRQYLFYGGAVLLSLLLFFLLEKAVVDYYYYLTHRIGNGTIRNYLLKVNVLIYLFVGVISVLYVFVGEWLKWQKMQAHFKAEQLSNQLQVLNYQINPHFLFNTLNNLFALAKAKENEELATGIARLSDIMRYILHDCGRDWVPLSHEVVYLQDYISIFKLRVEETDDLTIDFQVEGDPHEAEIAPMVLIPMVENAFKHGVRYRKPSFVRAELLVSEDFIECKVSNSKHANGHLRSADQSGIGLSNLRRRLDIVYKNNYELKIEDQAIFVINLKIPTHVH